MKINRIFYRLSLLLAAAFLSLPILSVTYVPLVDYPNHLARAYILFHYDEIPAYQLNYINLFEPIPNLAMDLILLLLQSFIDVLTAGRIFLVIMLAVFVFGCHALGKSIHGRSTWLALPCAFFFYNSAFLYGFVNYIFGLGLFCIALAYWYRWRHDWNAGRLVLASALVFCAYLAHLSAYVFLGISFLTIEVWSYRRGALRAAALGLVPLIPSLIAFMAFMRGSGQVGSIQWNTLSGKLIGALPLVLSYDYKLDIFLAAATFVILILLLIFSRRISLAWPFFIVGAVFVICYLLSPMVLFTSSGADARFVLPAILLFVLSLKVEVQSSAGKALMIAYLIVASIRVGDIWATWRTLDWQIGAEAERLMILPEGAAVYPLFVRSEEHQQGKLERTFEHTVHYATIYRRAYVPTLFALRGQQSLQFRRPPHYSTLSDANPRQWLHNLSDYDYVWSYGIDADTRASLAERSALISEANGFALWKIER